MAVKQKEILENNRLFYNQHFGLHDRVNSYISKKNCKEFYEKLFLKIVEKENLRLEKINVLELGCGTSNFLEFLLAQNIASYVGIDISEKMIDRAKKKSLKFNSSESISFYATAAEDFIKEMKAQNKKFDVIFSCSFLHHLFNPKVLLCSLEDIMAPNSIYIALHECNMSAKNKHGFAQCADGILAYLFGYDTTDSNILLRIKKIIFIFFRILARRTMFYFGKSDHKKDLDYVDYQLNFYSFNPLEIINASTNQNIHTYAEPYGYFVFDFLKKISKFSNNYFYLVKRAKSSL